MNVSSFLAGFLVALTCFSKVGLATQKKPSLTIAHVVAKETALGRSTDRIVESLNQAGFSAKAIHAITTLPGTTVAGEISGMQALKKDDIQMMFLSDGPCANVSTLCSFFTMPFLFNNTEHATTVADHASVMDAMNKDFEKSGLHLLAIYENGWRQMYSPDEQILSPEQIKGKHFRVMQSNAYMRFVSAMGGLPKPAPWPDVMELTRSRSVQVFEVPIQVFYTSKLYDVNKYITMSNHIYSVFYALVSTHFWNGLNATQKEKLKKIVWEERIRQRKGNEEDSSLIVDKLSKMKDVKVVTLTEAQRTKFKDATSGVFVEFKPKFPKELLSPLELGKK
jgi:tripartite ATP-independent transporter DctP family solute receptor